MLWVLVVVQPTHLQNLSQKLWNLPQVEVKIEDALKPPSSCWLVVYPRLSHYLQGF